MKFILLITAIGLLAVSTPSQDPCPVDNPCGGIPRWSEHGNIRWSDERARLDNLASQFRKSPAFFIVAHTILPVYSLQSVSDKKRGWRPATYRGLTVGKSTRRDMLRILGKPLSSVPSADQDPPMPIIWNDYGMIEGELPGRLAVEVDRRNNRIVGISIAPEQMSKEDVIRYFGKEYRLMGYEFCPGQPLDADVGLVYEDPKSSSIDYLEYRSRGIAVHLDYRGYVNAVYYVYEPMGLASKAECKRVLKRSRR